MTSPVSAKSDSPHKALAEQVVGHQIAAGAPVVSPDGSRVAYVVTRVDLKANTYRSQVWVADVDGSRAARPLTAGDKRDGNPCWSPDGTWLAFTSGRSEKKGETTLHVLPIGDSGELRTLATMPDGVNELRWSPDGRWLAFTSRTQDERYTAESEAWMSPRKIETFFTRLNGEDFVFDRPGHLYVVPADGTAAPRNLTPGGREHSAPAWTPDSTALVTCAALHDGWDLDLAVDLHLVSLDGSVRTLTKQTGTYYAPSVSPDGSHIAFLGNDDPTTYPQNERVGVLDVASGEHRWVSTALDRTFGTTSGSRAPIWESGSHLLGFAEDRGTAQVYRLDASGASAPVALTAGRHVVKSFDASAGTIAYAASTVSRPTEVFVLRDGNSRQVSRVGDALVSETAPLSWEHFTVACGSPYAGGPAEIDAWIMRPKDFDPARKYPVLLNVHGGPHTQYGETYFDEAQVQAAAGFVVLMSNPRGSSGREEAWGQAILGRKHHTNPGSGWGDADVADVMAVLDGALERFTFCDRNRIGMLGGSYGGYMATMLAARHGSRFRAICSERAVNNMLSEEWSSDIASVFRVQHGPNHLDDESEYRRMSPIEYVRDVSTPMLLIHSENDLRCPINQAEELFVALRLLGKDVTFYRFPGETHELSRSGSPVHRVQRFEILLDYFSERLAG